MAYWDAPALWPALGDHIFLLEAELQFGVAMFGNIWIGNEPSATFPTVELPVLSMAESNDLTRHIDAMTRERRTASKRRRRVKASKNVSGDGRHIAMTDAEFADHINELRSANRKFYAEQFDANVACLKSQADWDGIGKAIDRRRAVRTEFTALCGSGHILTVARRVVGGAPVDIDKHAWNGEHLDHRFELGLIDLNDPFMESTACGVCDYIFVNKKSLDPLLRIQERARGLARSAAARSGAGRTACKEYLNNLFETESDSKIKGANKPEIRAAALLKIDGLSGATFDSVWAQVTLKYPFRRMPGPAKSPKDQEKMFQ